MPHDVSSEENGVRSQDIPRKIKNVGSTARDACAIERNFLSYLRLGILLSLLSSSLLLNARISNTTSTEPVQAQLPLGTLFFVASLLATFSGWWAYRLALKEFLKQKAFLDFEIHEIALGFVALLVSGTCLYLLILEA
ncbi:hypothetical protein DL93DRAFT_1387937 [Clavulina sp. PMI_390]|nr:hypothetical protein DL93DRAFT_1387937 [Clavulina sp. PMI_390]